MTTEQFSKYCSRNKPTKVSPNYFGIDFHFKTRVIINAHCGIDGMIYTKWRKAAKGSSKSLTASLLEATPRLIDDMKRKYSIGADGYKTQLSSIGTTPIATVYKKKK